MADTKTLAICVGKFTLNIGPRDRRLLMLILFVVVVGGSLMLLRRNRWDAPWLAPDSNYMIIAVKFDNISCEDKRFGPLRDIVLTATYKGFRPADYGTNNAPWPFTYSYIRIDCFPHDLETLKADAVTYKKNLGASILKSGIKVDWHVAIISNNGDVLYPE